MTDWNEFQKRLDAWEHAGDKERLQLGTLYHEALRYRETDPEYQLTLLTQGRDEAQRFNEPWWVLFFDAWRLSTLTADLHDFARAHPLAMELLVRVAAPENRTHPMAINVQNGVLYTYLQVDPVGHREELERGFAHLDQQITRDPVSDRFVFSYRLTEYLCETHRWHEANAQAQRYLALVDRGGIIVWWQCWGLFLLCRITNALGLHEELAGYAEEMADQSTQESQLTRTRASGLIWLAVAQRCHGNERSASRCFHQGMHYLKDLSARDEICADAVAKYYELANDWKSALGTRDRELAAIAKKGMTHRSCIVQIERCRLLSQGGALTVNDVNDARSAAAALREPGWYLQKLHDLGIA